MVNRHLCFDGKLNYDTVNELINKIEEKLEKVDCGDKLSLTFSSTGGHVAASVALQFFLNDNCDNIRLLAGSDLHSCGLDVYLDYLGEKEINHGYCTVVVHLGSRDITRTERGSLNRKALEDDLDESNKLYLLHLKKLGFPKDVLDRVEDGEDVFLCYNDYKGYLK